MSYTIAVPPNTVSLQPSHLFSSNKKNNYMHSKHPSLSFSSLLCNMSFQDIGEGRGKSSFKPTTTRISQASASSSTPSNSNGVPSLIFQLNTSLSTFKRLVADIGTHKDSPHLRDQLISIRQQIGPLIKEISARLKQVSEADHQENVSASKRVADAKLVKDFQAVLKEYQKFQKLASEREQRFSSVNQTTQIQIDAGENTENKEEESLRAQQRQEFLQLENEVNFNEAIIEEKGLGIVEIQHQINEVSEIFKDLAVLVNEQGTIIDDIGSNIESSLMATTQAKTDLVKGSKSQKRKNSWSCWLLVIILVVIIVAVILIFVL